jgi:hypothetical protein
MRSVLCAVAVLAPSGAARLLSQRPPSTLRSLRGGAAAALRSRALSMSQSELLDKFELLRTDEVPERGITSALYRHRQTGAEVLSIEADDDNKVFSANFKTLPTDDSVSTGLERAHPHACCRCLERAFDPAASPLTGADQLGTHARSWRAAHP